MWAVEVLLVDNVGDSDRWWLTEKRRKEEWIGLLDDAKHSKTKDKRPSIIRGGKEAK